MFPYIPSGSHKLCCVFLLHSCSPSTPCIPESSSRLVVARYSFVSLGLSGSQARVQPGVSCSSALSHQHQARGLAHASSPINPISIGWTESNQWTRGERAFHSGVKICKDKGLGRVLSVFRDGEQPSVAKFRRRAGTMELSLDCQTRMSGLHPDKPRSQLQSFTFFCHDFARDSCVSLLF